MQRESRYWAFISYSHDDEAWARWLHRSLETWRVPRQIVGRALGDEKIPRRLFPVFRDRDELSGGGELGERVQEALRASRTLIVICSPASARSQWVEQEIRYFQSLGRDGRVLGLIVDGEPPDCFPRALTRDAEGQPVEPIAADARPQGDGRGGALIKLLAGILGVGLDDLRQREAQRQRLRRLQVAAAIVALGALAFLGWDRAQRDKTLALEQQAHVERLERLFDAGRRELTAGHGTRAAVLLNEVYASARDTPALRFLLAQAMAPVDARAKILTGAERDMARLAFSPDGRLLAGFADNQILHVWDLENGAQALRVRITESAIFEWSRPVFTPDGSHILTATTLINDEERKFHFQVWSLAKGDTVIDQHVKVAFEQQPFAPFDPDSRSIALPQDDGGVAVFALADGKPIASLRAPTRATLAGFLDEHTVISGHEDGTVRFRDWKSGREIRRFAGLQNPVRALDVSGEHLAIGAIGGLIRVWEMKTGVLLAAFGHTDDVATLSFDRSGNRLLSTSTDGVRVWDASGALVLAENRPLILNREAALSPDGGQLAVSASGHLEVLDVDARKLLFEFDGHASGESTIAYSADGSLIAGGGAGDGRVFLWRSRLRPEASYASADELQRSRPGGGSLTRDGRNVIGWSLRGDAWIWDAGGGPPLGKLDGAEQVIAIAHSHDGKRLLTSSKDGTLGLWDFASGRRLASMDAGFNRAFVVRFSPDDRHLLVAQQAIPTKAQIWDVERAEKIAELEPDFDESIAFSPDGRSVAMGSGARVKLWDIAEKRWRWSGNEMPAAADAPGFIMGIAFSRDGSRIVAISYSNVAVVVDVATGKEIARHTFADSAGLFGVTLSSDGGTAVIGDVGKTGRIWRIRDDRVLPLVGHAGIVGEVALFADDQLALTGSRDGTVKAWDVATGEMLGDVAIHGSAIDDLSFDADRTSLVTGTENGLRRWRLALEKRPATEIARVLQCRAPWKLDGETLVPSAIDAEECLGR